LLQILKKEDMNSTGSGQGLMAESCEHGN